MSTDASTRQRFVAYVAPFGLYMVLTTIETSRWMGQSYELVCALKGLLVAVTLWRCRRQYPRFSTTGFPLAIVAGGLGCVLWILLDRLQSAIPGMQQLMTWLLQGGRAAYDPYAGDDPAALRIAFVIVRLIEMSVIVPIMEEIFWRGFLARYLIADDFQNVPQGRFTPLSFAMVTLAFASVHPEILAAVAWGAAINVLYCKTANLWACVIMHAVTNAILAGYILATGSWHLW